MTQQIFTTEQDRFQNWIESEKNKGLRDIKLYPEITNTASTEDLHAELNDMNYAFASNRFDKITDL